MQQLIARALQIFRVVFGSIIHTKVMPPKERKGNVNCCVVNCHNSFRNSPPETRFYAFPTSNYKLERRKQWIVAVKRKKIKLIKYSATYRLDGSPWEPTPYSRICSQHFVGNQKSENQFSPSYIPTIFPPVYQKSTVAEEAALKRHERSMKRRNASNQGNSRKKLAADKSYSEEDPMVFEDATKQDVTEEKIDKQTQVEFLSQYNKLDACKVFTCNRYIYNSTCDAEVQAYIPEHQNRIFIHRKRNTADKNCGSDIICVDKASGPDTHDVNSKGLLKCQSGFHGVSAIKTNQEMLDLAGVTLHTFQLLLKILSDAKRTKISKKNRLLLFLMKMKCGLTYSALGVLFCIHRTTASRIFISTLQYLAAACKEFVVWPSKEVVTATMPQAFKDTYKDCRVIIDCTEIKVEQPSTVEQRVQLYSHYKKGFTLKVLVGCTPGGLISYISQCYGGRTSDSQITSSCGILDLIEPGDVILADKGFPGIKSTFDENGRGVVIVMPPFLHNPHFSKDEVDETYKIASVRIHIERIIQIIRIYRILTKFTLNMLPHSDDILFMCCALVNLQPPIIKESDSE